MKTEQIGYRRLYDALGCSLADSEELQIEVSIGDIDVQVYFGPQPKYGIFVTSNEGRYIVPDEVSPVGTWEYQADARKSTYPRDFFLEISCTKQLEVHDDLSAAFRAKDSGAQNELLRLAENEREAFRQIADLIAGTIGLRYHRQFVIELINENIFVPREGADRVINHAGNAMELLEGPALTQVGAASLTQLLTAIGQADEGASRDGATALVWLLRAWVAPDAISKFLSLFIPLEIILKGYGGDPHQIEENDRLVAEIERLITDHATEGKKELVRFFRAAVGRIQPSLNTRFEQLAGEAKLPGWKQDVVAFKRFNRLRNALVHQGERHLPLTISLDESKYEDQTHQLQDIAERYVSWALFRDGIVYQSQWRTERRVDE